MPRSAVERQAERNRTALDLEAFTSMLLAALEIPDVRHAVRKTLASTERTAVRSRQLATNAAHARDVKDRMIRERGSRG